MRTRQDAGSDPGETGTVRAGPSAEARGFPIGPNDMLIVAHALSRGLTVVTENVGELGRVKSLRVDNWR